MFKFEVKFANLSHRDPNLENVNLNLRCDSIKFNLLAVTIRRRSKALFATQEKEKGGYKKGTLLLRLCLTTAE